MLVEMLMRAWMNRHCSQGTRWLTSLTKMAYGFFIAQLSAHIQASRFPKKEGTSFVALSDADFFGLPTRPLTKKISPTRKDCSSAANWLLAKIQSVIPLTLRSIIHMPSHYILGLENIISQLGIDQILNPSRIWTCEDSDVALVELCESISTSF